MIFTGERFIPTEQGKIRLEHYHRYAAVIDIVANKDVLDVACGEGYGSSFIADMAHLVVGVDISEEAVQHASAIYRKRNLTFLQGSAIDLNFAEASFDVVVSFETIEHLSEQPQMLAEIRRVLRPDGLLVISSPNRPIYSEESGDHNEFHVKELDFKEFDELLRAQFQSIKYFGQRFLMGSVIQAMDGIQCSFRAWHDDGNELRSNAGHLTDPVYFVAVCGNNSAVLPGIDTSVLYPGKLDLVKHYVGFAKWAKECDQEKDRQVQEKDRQIATIYGSYSWRLTLPLRTTRRWALAQKEPAKQYIKAILRLANRLYHILPFSYQNRMTHRAIVNKVFPQLLRISQGNRGTCASQAFLDGTRVVRPRFDGPPDFDKEIRIASSEENPLVSIIIPIHGKINYTWQCLSSIAATPSETTFEVIVIDDLSPDNSAAALEKVKGIKVIRNSENFGFIRSCNLGASVAKGQYLYFLNNDTEVTAGWLDELVRTFEEFPGTGLAGSKLVYPDGRLQEAGGIIWRDGSACNFGKFQDPSLPMFNYAREVDYCSGASIMVPKSIFIELGGFDEHYLPAYCEDSDFALKVRDKGYRVIYQPLSTVIHYEGVTSGIDTTKGVKAFQVENSKKLYDRWQRRLKTCQAPGENINNAKDRRARHRVLVIDACTPTPDQDAGSMTVFNLLLLLREMDFQVTFIPESNFVYIPEYTSSLQRNGMEALYAPYITSVKEHLQKSDGRYDLVFLFRPDVADRNIRTIQKYCSNAKILYHTVDLHFLRIKREAELLNDKAKIKQAEKMKQLEFAAIRASDASIVHSTIELELLRSELPHEKIHVFPLIMDVRGTNKGFAERRDIVFFGGYQHPPNVDAVLYFVSEIMPLLRKQLPGVCFYVAGSKLPPEIQALASEDIIIKGFVADLNSFLDKILISVVPLRYGAGIKGKIGSAMAVGLPVVATTPAVEGMSLTNGENILVADGPESFASAIADIYNDENLWNKISKAGLEFAKVAWGAEASWKVLANILSEMGFHVQRNLHPLKLCPPTIHRPDFPSIEQSNGHLQPIFVAHSRKDYEQGLQRNEFSAIHDFEKQLIENATTESFTVDGFCAPCNKSVPFLVDMLFGGQQIGCHWVPNWRERLVCPICRMFNRQRLIATLVKQQIENYSDMKVYFMEQTTPIYQWAVAAFPQHQIIGSEYLGAQYRSGQPVKGIRHEDVMNLSFYDLSIDLIVSNDVFEHVPDPGKAFAECARVLRSGGELIATIPFHSGCDSSVVRAKLASDGLNHLLPPTFHQNPISKEGSLVFTDFGWDILEMLHKAGFDDNYLEVYASARNGHIGGGQLVFRATKGIGGSSPSIEVNSKRKPLSAAEPNQDYLKKIQQELSIYAKQEKVHDLPNIYHYWSNKFIAPIFREAGIQSIEDFFASNLVKAKNRTGSSPAYFVSIGSGNCDLEIRVAKNMIDSGYRDFIFECVEINPEMLERGKTLARDNGLLANMEFVEADFNSWCALKKYDGVMANQSLHHVSDLEHLYDQIKNGLKDKGSFVINDVIGRNGHQRWPESLEIVNRFWKELPKSYKFNVLLNRFEQEYDNWDCSKEGFEGVRAQDVLPLLLERFESEKFIGFGNAIDIFVDRAFGHHFKPDLQWDREFIDRVHAEDEAGLREGRLTPTHMLAVFVKSLQCEPYYAQGRSPVPSIRSNVCKTMSINTLKIWTSWLRVLISTVRK